MRWIARKIDYPIVSNEGAYLQSPSKKTVASFVGAGKAAGGGRRAENRIDPVASILRSRGIDRTSVNNNRNADETRGSGKRLYTIESCIPFAGCDGSTSPCVVAIELEIVRGVFERIDAGSSVRAIGSAASLGPSRRTTQTVGFWPRNENVLRFELEIPIKKLNFHVN